MGTRTLLSGDRFDDRIAHNTSNLHQRKRHNANFTFSAQSVSCFRSILYCTVQTQNAITNSVRSKKRLSAARGTTSVRLRYNGRLFGELSVLSGSCGLEMWETVLRVPPFTPALHFQTKPFLCMSSQKNVCSN